MDVDYYRGTILPTSWWRRVRGRGRLFWNLCPRCNSDAPAVDCCWVCRNVQLGGVTVPNRRNQYPPSLATKALWWYCWCHPDLEDQQRYVVRKHIERLGIPKE